ncbi:MAG: Capsule synthesis protein, CapA [Candidatus Nomurabacteria bacterium GW2011_GWA1_46_11]|uniref:Capsule synthesis protein, CapA n=1 Tax=Candidatus Nomurabacteria bacterium GW2011_GWA1_46_11 TaxID=1618732 RepID=A0A0G1NKB8_9BACT|nr:MAG: Capsule synthesis protein, CapA [Candidatus Nomurabacteria bacterium GW2011_GWA1_46_11]
MLKVHQPVCVIEGAIILAGDVIITESVSSSLGRDEFLFQDSLQDMLRNDTFFGNFEGAIIEKHNSSYVDNPKRFLFHAAPATLSFFKTHFGTCIFSFANNHCFDYGVSGLEETIKNLKQASIAGIGLGRNKHEAVAPYVVALRKLNVAFVALTDLLPEVAYASPNQPGAAQLTKETLVSAIQDARSVADIVIVSLHTIADLSQAFSFWPDYHQTAMARLAIDCGADIVVGHQPHGLQLIERYRNKIIFHSLGAFIYDPALSSTFPPSHRLWPATQIYGGGLVRLSFCQRGLHDYSVIPTNITGAGIKLALVTGSRYRQFLAKAMKAYASGGLLFHSSLGV